MAKQFAVFHIEKAHSSVGGLGNHIDRSVSPPNADKDKSHLNQMLIDHRKKGGLKAAIDARISEGYKGKKTIRKDAVKAMNMVLTGSHEQMKKIEEDPKALRKWLEENYRFLKNYYGASNIVSMALHRDERTPHLHAVVVPLTADGRLSAKEVMGDRKKMSAMQGTYAKSMESFGLSRGLKGSKATHDSVQEYYARMMNPIEAEIEYKEKHSVFGDSVKCEVDKEVLENLILQQKGVVKRNKEYHQAYLQQRKIMTDMNAKREEAFKTAKTEGFRQAMKMANEELQPSKVKLAIKENKLTLVRIDPQQKKSQGHGPKM